MEIKSTDFLIDPQNQGRWISRFVSLSVLVRLVFHLTDLGELFLSGFQFAARAPADIVSAAIFFVVRTPSALSPSRFLGRFSGS
jgi:hypothetical protein